MKRRVLYSLLIGLVLVLLSLFFRTGDKSLEPMPYINNGCANGFACGAAIVPPTPTVATNPALAKRGLLLPIVSIRADEDTPGNYYKSLIISNLIFDYAFFSVVSFGFLSLLSMDKKTKPKSQPRLQ